MRQEADEKAASQFSLRYRHLFGKHDANRNCPYLCVVWKGRCHHWQRQLEARRRRKSFAGACDVYHGSFVLAMWANAIDVSRQRRREHNDCATICGLTRSGHSSIVFCPRCRWYILARVYRWSSTWERPCSECTSAGYIPTSDRRD